MTDEGATTAYADDPARRLRASVATFTAIIQALSDDVFLRRFGAWAPRDVVAHLIGWNGHTLRAIEQIQRGEMPPYIADIPNDFANVNAASVRLYPSTDKADLLAELERTAAELLAALARLAPADWTRDFGARNPIGQPLLIQRQVDALSEDYLGHGAEIAQWAAGAS